MNRKAKISAVIAGSALALGTTLVSAPAASAAPANISIRMDSRALGNPPAYLYRSTNCTGTAYPWRAGVTTYPAQSGWQSVRFRGREKSAFTNPPAYRQLYPECYGRSNSLWGKSFTVYSYA